MNYSISPKNEIKIFFKRMSQSPLEGTISNFSSRYLNRRILLRNKRQFRITVLETTSLGHLEEKWLFGNVHQI